MIKLFISTIMFLIISSQLAYAADIDKAKEAFLKKYPKLHSTIPVVKATDSLYATYINKRLALFDEKVSYVLFGGNLVNSTSEDITKDVYERVSDAWIKSLPLSNAFSVKYGTGKNKIYVFTDPDCPYCADFQKTLATLGKDGKINLEVYYFLMPLKEVHPDAMRHSVDIWCSADKGLTYGNLTSLAMIPPNKDCKNPIDDNIKLAKSYGFDTTPTVVFENGYTYEDAPNAEYLLKVLEYINTDSAKK